MLLARGRWEHVETEDKFSTTGSSHQSTRSGWQFPMLKSLLKNRKTPPATLEHLGVKPINRILMAYNFQRRNHCWRTKKPHPAPWNIFLWNPLIISLMACNYTLYWSSSHSSLVMVPCRQVASAPKVRTCHKNKSSTSWKSSLRTSKK